MPLDPAADECELQGGARFGRYIVLDLLGAGGAGIVYEAHDPELDRRVALKVLRGDGAGADARRPVHDLLLREAQAMAQLAHPNVVTVFDVGRVEGRVFIAMELVEGQTLARWLRAQRRTPPEIIGAFVAAGRGLAAAHAAGLVHRDFKPENVLVGSDGRVRVTDFGLARHASITSSAALQRGNAEAATSNAAPSGVAGTLGYMAPEQYLGRSPDARADQFSFAVALCGALCGELPLSSPEAWLTPRSLARLHGDGVPAGLRQALLRALSRESEHRYPSMNDLLAAMVPRSRRSRPLWIVGIAILSAAVVAAGGYAIQLRRTSERRTELVGRLRSMAPELRTELQSAHMLPLHDIRPARAQLRQVLAGVERERQTPAGQDEIALIDFVLGEGYRALGDRKRALPLLEAAWEGGERGPHVEAALGAALGDAYEDEFERIEEMVPSSDRDDKLDAIRRRYRDPAMDHLRSALVANAASPMYLEALIAYHAHRFTDAARSAHAAFGASPLLYEAGVLDARAHHETGQQLLAGDRRDEAEAEFARARESFERVLETARSDDAVWLADGEMVYAQALALARGELPGELRHKAIAAMRTARQINPENWEALVREMEVYEKEANIAIIGYRDPSVYVEAVLALALEARELGADSDQVDVNLCLATWERAIYQSDHAIDPRPSLQQAVVACERAAAVRPDSDKYASLGAVYSSLAGYEAEHGGDPTQAFERGERSLRRAISIDDRNAVLHYALGRLLTSVAHHRQSHGQSPEHIVTLALSELETSFAMDATRVDARASMADALIARARFERAEHREAGSLNQARIALDEGRALRPDLVAPLRYRLMLAELDAEARLERGADPAHEVTRIESGAQLLLRRVPADGFAYRLQCRAQVLAARWAVAHRRDATRMLSAAASAATHARDADPRDPRSWAASAEVEVLRAASAHDRQASAQAIANAHTFLDRALQIDPRLVWTNAVSDELTRQAAAR